MTSASRSTTAVLALLVSSLILALHHDRHLAPKRVLPIDDYVAKYRTRYPWNVVRANEPWHPALTHPDAREIITSVLQDWLYRTRQNSGSEMRIYEDPPKLTQVRLLRFQLPSGFMPSISGAGFLLQDQTLDNRDRALMGTVPGDFGLRFDTFNVRDGNTVEFTMCLLQHADHKRRGGWSITYLVRRANGRWKATLTSILT